MEGKLPEIYWYVFWIGVCLISMGAAYIGGKSGHERAMKALDILKGYADKGIEPPPAMMEQISRQVLDAHKPGPHPQAPPPADGGRGALVQSFMGFLFAACIFGGLYYWFKDEHFPNWAVYAAQAMFAFFGLSSIGFLLAALFTRTK
jgi:hypothetical protein